MLWNWQLNWFIHWVRRYRFYKIFVFFFSFHFISFMYIRLKATIYKHKCMPCIPYTIDEYKMRQKMLVPIAYWLLCQNILIEGSKILVNYLILFRNISNHQNKKKGGLHSIHSIAFWKSVSVQFQPFIWKSNFNCSKLLCP